MTIPRPVVVIFCVLPWIAAAFGIGVLFYLRFPPSGNFVVSTTMDGKSPWIFPFLPSERVTSPGVQPDGWAGQRITGDPVYATARIPGPYQTADVTVEYRTIHQPLVEFGVVRDGAGTQLELTPFYSSGLNASEWTRVTDGFVRAGSASSLQSVPTSRTLTWDAPVQDQAPADPAGAPVTTQVSLRGSHDFYVVPAGGKLSMTFWFQDANRTSGTDTIAFRVSRNDVDIPEAAYVLNAATEQRMGALQMHTISLLDAKPGVYRISFAAQDDVFLRKIETTSKHWVVGPRVYFGDTVGYATTTAPVNIWTNSQHIVAETFHAEGEQTVSFGETTQAVVKTHTAYRLDRESDASIVSLRAPKGDIRFVMDGYAALRSDAFFEPKPRRFTDASSLDSEGIDAVVTTYTPPVQLADGWMRSTLKIGLRPDAEILRFVLSAPGVASRLGSVDIRRVQIQYHRPEERFADWMQTLRQELANAWHRL